MSSKGWPQHPGDGQGSIQRQRLSQVAATSSGIVEHKRHKVGRLQLFGHGYMTSKFRSYLELLNLFMSMASVSFYVNDTYNGYSKMADSVYLACSVTFFVEYVCKLSAVKNRKKILQYLFASWSLVDAITIIFGVLNFIFASNTSGISFIRALRMIQVVRLLRSITALSFTYMFGHLQPMKLQLHKCAFDIIMFLLALVFVSACIFYEVEQGAVADADPGSVLQLHQAIYWACVTISTIGYGDYSPTTALGQLLLPLLLFLLVLVLPNKAGTLTGLLQDYNKYQRSRYNGSGHGRHVVLCGSFDHNTAGMFIAEFFHPDRGYQDLDLVVLRAEPYTPAVKLLRAQGEHDVLLLQGSVFEANDLARASVTHALAIFVMCDKSPASAETEDTHTLMSVLAVSQFLRQYSAPNGADVPRVVSWASGSWRPAVQDGRVQAPAQADMMPHIVAQFHRTEAMEQAAQLLESQRDHPLELGLSPVDSTLFPLCVGALKHSLLGASLHVPGVITLITNLCISTDVWGRTHQGLTAQQLVNGCGWLHEYLLGAAIEVYHVQFPAEYHELTFHRAAELLLLRHDVILLGLRWGHAAADRSGVALAPFTSGQHIAAGQTSGFVLSENQLTIPEVYKHSNTSFRGHPATSHTHHTTEFGDDDDLGDQSYSDVNGSSKWQYSPKHLSQGQDPPPPQRAVFVHQCGQDGSHTVQQQRQDLQGHGHPQQQQEAQQRRQRLDQQQQQQRQQQGLQPYNSTPGRVQNEVSSSVIELGAGLAPHASVPLLASASLLDNASNGLATASNYSHTSPNSNSTGGNSMPAEGAVHGAPAYAYSRSGSGSFRQGPSLLQQRSGLSAVAEDRPQQATSTDHGYSLLRSPQGSNGPNNLNGATAMSGLSGAEPVTAHSHAQRSRSLLRRSAMAALGDNVPRPSTFHPPMQPPPPPRLAPHPPAPSPSPPGMDLISNGVTSGNQLAQQQEQQQLQQLISVGGDGGASGVDPQSLQGRSVSLPLQVHAQPPGPESLAQISFHASMNHRCYDSPPTSLALGCDGGGNSTAARRSISTNGASIFCGGGSGGGGQVAGQAGGGGNSGGGGQIGRQSAGQVDVGGQIVEALRTMALVPPAAADVAAAATTEHLRLSSNLRSARPSLAGSMAASSMLAGASSLETALGVMAAEEAQPQEERRDQRAKKASRYKVEVHRDHLTAGAAYLRRPTVSRFLQHSLRVGEEWPSLPVATNTRKSLEHMVLLIGSSCFDHLYEIIVAFRAAPQTGGDSHLSDCPVIIMDPVGPDESQQAELIALGSAADGVSILKADPTRASAMVLLNISRGAQVHAVVVPPSTNRSSHGGWTGSLPDAATISICSNLRRYCRKQGASVTITTELDAQLNASYLLPLCMEGGPYDRKGNHALATLSYPPTDAHPSAAMIPARHTRCTPHVGDFLRWANPAGFAVHRDTFLRGLLTDLPHLAPPLAAGHVLLPDFLDALFCQTLFNPFLQQILQKLLGAWSGPPEVAAATDSSSGSGETKFASARATASAARLKTAATAADGTADVVDGGDGSGSGSGHRLHRGGRPSSLHASMARHTTPPRQTSEFARAASRTPLASSMMHSGRTSQFKRSGGVESGPLLGAALCGVGPTGQTGLPLHARSGSPSLPRFDSLQSPLGSDEQPVPLEDQAAKAEFERSHVSPSRSPRRRPRGAAGGLGSSRRTNGHMSSLYSDSAAYPGLGSSRRTNGQMSSLYSDSAACPGLGGSNGHKQSLNSDSAACPGLGSGNGSFGGEESGRKDSGEPPATPQPFKNLDPQLFCVHLADLPLLNPITAHLLQRLLRSNTTAATAAAAAVAAAAAAAAASAAAAGGSGNFDLNPPFVKSKSTPDFISDRKAVLDYPFHQPAAAYGSVYEPQVLVEDNGGQGQAIKSTLAAPGLRFGDIAIDCMSSNILCIGLWRRSAEKFPYVVTKPSRNVLLRADDQVYVVCSVTALPQPKPRADDLDEDGWQHL